ncbi:hypothetical protein [Stakelama saccharophila]|uniref:Uncharacterized protein n=1 Tax=Stakelama saccharophila TaxID=3075605 RepID=A0ABZ0BC01_9SPHN|nr:hypothetical protein [Stakelama sp. W311]WNO54580.1 hypothetical protein RPR59_04815 [Stakelama sp. W311]
MSFLTLLAALAVSQSTAVPAGGSAAARPMCQTADVKEVTEPSTALHVKPLEEEPKTRQEIAVLRFENGCIDPVIVREDVG